MGESPSMTDRQSAQVAARTAARWWADKLREPSPLDNGDAESTASVNRLMTTMGQSRDLDPGLVDLFEVELAERIEAALYEGRWAADFSSGVDLSTDYHAGPMLRDAAEAAGIQVKMWTFPWKIGMLIELGTETVRVSDGYGASWVELELTPDSDQS